MRCLILLAIVDVLSIFVELKFMCTYRPPSDDQVSYDVPFERKRIRRTERANEAKSLRFSPVYDESVHKFLDNSSMKYLKEELIPQTLSYWSNVLSLKQNYRYMAAPMFQRKCTADHPFDGSIDFNGLKGTVCYSGCANGTRKCGSIVVPDRHLLACFRGDRFTGQIYEEFKQGSGASDVDFIIYIATMYDSSCDSNETVAFAAHCMQSLETGRPLAGHTNICPNQLIRRPRNHQFLLSTLKHELAHALGMSASLFGSFRHANGKKMSKSSVVQNFTFTDWYTRLGPMNHSVSYIVTPNVREFARQHFNCSTLIGAELENQGSQGTAGTHWEKRVYENEGMAGTHTQNPVYSGLTLAIMQDTGWYEVNNSLAENLLWGKSLGCDFAQKSCAFWIRSRRDRNESIDPFCDIVKPRDQKATRTRCTLDRSSVSQCTLVEYEDDLPIEYQIFDSLPDVDQELIGRYGGSVSLADYCPYQQEFEWKAVKNNRIRDSRCFLAENTPDRNINFAMEEYGSKSKCFLHGNTSWIMKKCSHFTQNVVSTSGCHEFLCESGLLWITFLNQTYKYPCFKDGQRISVKRIWRGWAHEGAIICPSCLSICGDEQNFTCKDSIEPPYFVGDSQVDVPCSSIMIDQIIALFLPYLIILYRLGS